MKDREINIDRDRKVNYLKHKRENFKRDIGRETRYRD